MNPNQMSAKLKVICMGIQIKLNRDENLEEILSTYSKLTDEELKSVRDYFISK